jgi:hypothetical protein
VRQRNACGSGDNPPDVLVRLVPHFHTKRHFRGMSCRFGFASSRSNSSTRK